MRLKVLSYNIHKGFDWKNKNYYLNEIKQLLHRVSPDLIFLQEVIGSNDKFREIGLIDKQFEFLSDTIWTEYAYAKNAVYSHGHHGNLILSKFPIVSWENFNISTNFIESRGLLLCKIQIPQLNDLILQVGCTHLNLLHRDRKNQYEMIKKKILSLPLNKEQPMIIAGDFNDWNQKSHLVFENQLGFVEVFKTLNKDYAKTFPAAFPVLKLDRIYVRNLQIINSQLLKNLPKVHFSDHLPLFCELEILAPNEN